MLRTNILNISLDRNFPYIHDIVIGIRSVSPGTLRKLSRIAWAIAIVIAQWERALKAKCLNGDLNRQGLITIFSENV